MANLGTVQYELGKMDEAEQWLHQAHRGLQSNNYFADAAAVFEILKGISPQFAASNY